MPVGAAADAKPVQELQVQTLIEQQQVDRVVLAHAVRGHAEHRVPMNGHKTVLFT